MSEQSNPHQLTRSIEAGDLDAIAEIHWEAARIVYAYRGWRFSLAELRDWYAERLPDWDWGRIALAPGMTGSNRPVGFAASIGPFLDQLFVLSAYQRAGIGRLLLNAMLVRGLRPVRLHVMKGNVPARTFYESHGFLPERTWWYSEEEETVVLYRLD